MMSRIEARRQEVRCGSTRHWGGRNTEKRPDLRGWPETRRGAYASAEDTCALRGYGIQRGGHKLLIVNKELMSGRAAMALVEENPESSCQDELGSSKVEPISYGNETQQTSRTCCL